MLVVAVLFCSSVIVTGKFFTPGAVPTATVATKVNVFPLPPNAWVAEPPIEVKSAATVIPVLVGSLPGCTLTVRVELSPGCTPIGFAEPVPERTAQLFVGECEFRGVGAPTTKSLALLSVSVHPSVFLIAAVVLVVAAVGPVPSKQFAVVP